MSSCNKKCINGLHNNNNHHHHPIPSTCSQDKSYPIKPASFPYYHCNLIYDWYLCPTLARAITIIAT